MTAHAVTLLGVPYDASSSFMRGPALAPPAIREALHSAAGHLWTELGVDLSAPGVLTDAGDLAIPDDVPRKAIEHGVATAIANGGRVLSLGGDHSITYPILRALRPKYPGLTIVQIDAHPDLYDSYDGDLFSHASPFARILDEQLVHKLVQVGIRTMNGTQRPQAEKFGVDVIDMRAFASGARPNVRGPIYVSLDIDGIDPAHAPGVSHREPGGLTVRDVLGLIHALPGPIVGADIVEYNVTRDIDGMTAQVCAKLVKELAGRMSE